MRRLAARRPAFLADARASGGRMASGPLASHAVAVGRRFSGWVHRGGAHPEKWRPEARAGLSWSCPESGPLTLEPEGAGEGSGGVSIPPVDHPKARFLARLSAENA